jgi:hypothetical protein
VPPVHVSGLTGTLRDLLRARFYRVLGRAHGCGARKSAKGSTRVVPLEWGATTHS